MALIPFITGVIILLFIGFVYASYQVFLKKSVPPVRVRPGLIYRVLIGYIFVLSVLALVFFSFIQPKLPEYEHTQMEGYEVEYETEEAWIYRQVTPEFLHDQREITVEGDVFHIRTSLTEEELLEQQGVTIVIERTQDTRSSVGVEQYTGRGDITIPAYIDITDKLSPNTYGYAADGIEIVENNQMDRITLAIFARPVIDRQFQKESTTIVDTSTGYGMGMESEVLRLRVPEHMEIKIDDVLEEIVYEKH